MQAASAAPTITRLKLARCVTGQMPKLELFTSLVRTDMAENSYILEEALEGMHLAAGAFFRSAPC